MSEDKRCANRNREEALKRLLKKLEEGNASEGVVTKGDAIAQGFVFAKMPEKGTDEYHGYMSLKYHAERPLAKFFSDKATICGVRIALEAIQDVLYGDQR